MISGIPCAPFSGEDSSPNLLGGRETGVLGWWFNLGLSQNTHPWKNAVLLFLPLCGMVVASLCFIVSRASNQDLRISPF